MFVAVCDQLFGTSTSSCRKIVTPFSFPIRAVRFSHSTASKGDFFPSVNTRWKLRPFPAPAAVLSTAASVAGDFPLNFSLRTRTVSWPHTNLVESPTPVRLALPRPPNLDSQYQLWDISCQVKNAKYG